MVVAMSERLRFIQLAQAGKFYNERITGPKDERGKIQRVEIIVKRGQVRVIWLTSQKPATPKVLMFSFNEVELTKIEGMGNFQVRTLEGLWVLNFHA